MLLGQLAFEVICGPGAFQLAYRIERPGACPATGALWRPARPRLDPPLVLCDHGASGDCCQAPIPALARRFTEEDGCALLALDGPLHGLRQVGAGGREA